MNTIIGCLRKMAVREATPVHYTLTLNQQAILLNDKIGAPLHLHFTGKIYCVECGRKITKSFQQGYCYPCFRQLLECNLCMIHPEKCHASADTCPSDQWAHASCLQPHIVYLANSSGVKVGVTRASNIPDRWIDQGAIQALPIFRTKNRRQAGFVEVVLKAYVADKTNWHTMLKGNVTEIDLGVERDELLLLANAPLTRLTTQYTGDIEGITDGEVTRLHYPVLSYPDQVNAINLDKHPCVEGRLLGIKGQYCLLDVGVINIRKFSGYEVELG